MASAVEREVVEALLARHGRTYAEELQIPLDRGTPSPLFRWLVAVVLLSARINAGLAVRAARELSRRGWTSADRMARTSWEARVAALDRGGYARYRERAASTLGDVAPMLLRRYGGDLRRLREAAGRDPDAIRGRLLQIRGIGEVGADIFCREVQLAWGELHPFVDARTLGVAGRLGLPDDPGALAKLVDREAFPRLVTALLRADLAHDVERMRQE